MKVLYLNFLILLILLPPKYRQLLAKQLMFLNYFSKYFLLLFDTINIIFVIFIITFSFQIFCNISQFKPLFQYFQAKFIITKLLNFRKSYGRTNELNLSLLFKKQIFIFLNEKGSSPFEKSEGTPTKSDVLRLYKNKNLF